MNANGAGPVCLANLGGGMCSSGRQSADMTIFSVLRFPLYIVGCFYHDS